MPITNLSSKRLLTSFLFFISGFSGLIYQVLWTRQFKFLLGSSIVSISIIVAAFMSGLLIGSWWIGKRISRNKVGNELKFYGYLELIIGIYGIALLFLLPYTKGLFSFFGEPSVHFNYFKLIFDIFLTFLFLVFPTAAMGATLPLLINYFTKKEGDFRKTISHFYSINALGGAIASLVAGFYLIRYFGVNGSVWVAILLNLAIGLIAVIVSLKDKTVNVDSELEKKVVIKETSNWLTKSVLITSFLTGFIAIAYEVLWIRCLNYIVNNSTYTFSIILFVFLLGIALGSMIVSYFKRIKNQIFAIAILQGLLSISGLLIIYLFYEFAYTNTFSDWFLQSDSDTPIWYQTIGLNVSFSVLVFLLPSIFMGMTFPLLSDLYYKSKKIGSGEAISKVYVVNTLGSILGALIPVFVFIPLLGSIKATLYLLAGINLIITLYYLYSSKIGKRIPIIIAVVFCFGFLLFSTKSNNVLASLENVVEDSKKDTPLFYKEGVMATVKVYKLENKYKALSINGVTIASESFKTKERTIGHLPFFTERKINNVLAVGLASGSTVGAILEHPEVEHLDVVEIVNLFK